VQRVQIPILPSDVPSGDGYGGADGQPAADGNLALLGCVWGQGSGDGSVIVHEWDGTKVTVRPLSTPLSCDRMHSDYERPLLDGTWVLNGNYGVLLMRP
jgi:hypothetical protein